MWLVRCSAPSARRNLSPPDRLHLPASATSTILSNSGVQHAFPPGSATMPWKLQMVRTRFVQPLSATGTIGISTASSLECRRTLFHHVLAVPCTIPVTYNRLKRGRASGWSGRASRCRAGRTAGAQDAADALARSAARGRELAALLDPDTPVPGVTRALAEAGNRGYRRPRHRRRAQHGGRGFRGDRRLGPLRPGRRGDAGPGPRRRTRLRGWTNAKRWAARWPRSARPTFDIWLNGEAFWRNVPAAVWTYRLGGYQVLKKWLSYRERDVLGRELRSEEVQHFADTARRIGAILSMPEARTGT